MPIPAVPLPYDLICGAFWALQLHELLMRLYYTTEEPLRANHLSRRLAQSTSLDERASVMEEVIQRMGGSS